MSTENDPENAERTATRSVDFEAVARVSTRVSLSSVTFFTAAANRFVEASMVHAGWHDKAFVGFHTRVADLPGENAKLVTHVSFLALAKSGVDLTETGPGGLGDDNPDVALEAELELTYDVSPGDELAGEDAEHFAQANGTLHAWPYWREFAQSGSLRLGIEPMVVGLFKLPWASDPVVGIKPPPDSEN